MPVLRPQTRKRNPTTRDASPTTLDDIPEPPTEPPRKRRKPGSTAHSERYAQWRESLLLPAAVNDHDNDNTPALSPGRHAHSIGYHRPLLLHRGAGDRAREALLSWFDGVRGSRPMPWRKDWVDPGAEPDPDARRRALEQRAYEVWISEVMLQQTRVAVVADYWTRWMARWPRIEDLAGAGADDVLAAWRGLGYYSRATRIHDAARLVVRDPDMRGLLPAETAELEKRVPGVGRYTAGAISAIVFGRAAPMVDGNVVRVLTRQLGIFGSAKTNKSVSDAIWDVADALVRTVAQDPSQDVAGDGEAPVSDRPGRWGQALMELGSTICTPKPDCSRCPITSTCRAYAEGLSIADGPARTNGTGATTLVDIEDLCQLCEPFDEDAVPGGINDCDDLAQTATRADDKPSRSRRAKVTQTVNISNGEKASTESPPSADTMAVIVDHARKFPPKAIKKAVREEECLVCAILRSDGQYLIHRRPSKGLLAGLWELPSHTLPASNQSTAQSRKRGAAAYVAGLFPDCAEKSQRQKRPRLKHCGELGSVPWLFSHLKLTMHVHLFTLDHRADQSIIMARADQLHRWASDGEVDGESMGTGMRKCWALVRDCDTAQ